MKADAGLACPMSVELRRSFESTANFLSPAPADVDILDFGRVSAPHAESDPLGVRLELDDEDPFEIDDNASIA
jgi:hypothetical protein